MVLTLNILISVSNKMPRLFPHAVPSQILPVGSVDKPETSPQKRLRIARASRVTNRGSKRFVQYLSYLILYLYIIELLRSVSV